MFTDVSGVGSSDPTITAGQPIRRSELPALRIAVMGLVFGLVLSLALTPPANAQQTRYMTGQDARAGVRGVGAQNADGTFSMVFGYMNRNYEEELDVPIGADNHFEPLDADQGQPAAHFYARRQQFMFKVRVPKDWGQKDLIWTLTSHGKTEKAFGTLTPVWEIDTSVYQQKPRRARRTARRGCRADDRAGWPGTASRCRWPAARPRRAGHRRRPPDAPALAQRQWQRRRRGRHARHTTAPEPAHPGGRARRSTPTSVSASTWVVSSPE